MHDGIAPGWRQTLDRHHENLVGDLTAQMEAEIGSSVGRAVAEARMHAADELRLVVLEERARANESRRQLSESLNQTLRRIRQTSAEHETLQLLLEDSALWSQRAVVLLVEDRQARVASSRGAFVPLEEEDADPIALSDAAAIAACVESRDPVVALAAPGEVSPVLASALSAAGGDKVYLFPVTARQNTVAVLVACGDVTPAPIELLCEVAGMKLESYAVTAVDAAPDVRPTENTPLVQIAGPKTEAENKATTWTRLTPEEQALHLRAQRTARVRVAQMRISDSEALRSGIRTGDIYSTLRPAIDAAREEYRRAYISQTPTMVDYLHLEIMRSLAHDDSRLLGKDYPGPIA
jgi:hypothetical protein